MNIGGEDYRFRILLDAYRKGQILIRNEAGAPPKRYSEYFKSLDRGNIQKIADAMRMSPQEPLNAQTPWVQGDEEVADKATREIMREIMIVSQVAEAARPTDESFNELKRIMDEATVGPTDSVFQGWQDKINSLLRDNEKSLGLSNEQYNKLEKGLLVENRRFQEIATKVINSLPTVTNDDILALLSLPEDVPLKTEFKDELAETVRKLSSDFREQKRKSYLKKVDKYHPKTGRLPAADKVVRAILLEISQGKFTSFKEAFLKHFPNSLSGGTQQAKNDMFDGNELEALSDSDDEEPPYKKMKLSPKESATVDGDKSEVEAEIEKSLSESSCQKRRKRDVSCNRKRLKVVDDSFRWDEDTLYYQTVDEDGRKITHKVDLDLEKMATPKFIKERFSNLQESGLYKVSETTGKALGGYGAVVSMFASIHYFSQEDYGRGAFSAIQATHAIGGLTGVNDVVAKVTKQAFRRIVTSAAEKIGLEKTLTRISELGAKALGESTSKVLGRLVGDLPYVGLAFDVYFIVEDIKDLTDETSVTPEALKIVHLVLDVDTTLLILLETAAPELVPFVEPFVILLTIERMAIDNFYLDIKDELEKVKGKGFGKQLKAFFKGFLEGIADFFTLGVIQQINGLKRQQDHDRQLLRNLTDPVSYFNVTFQGLDEHGEPVGTVDFTAGILSQYGGFCIVKLNENGTFTVELPEVPTESGIPTRVVRTFSFDHPVNNVVLGVGEVANPRYIKKKAKLWLLIPVFDVDIIDGFDDHQSSRYGVYTGNSQDNNFYAVQGGTARRKRSPAYNKYRHRRTAETEQDCEGFSEITVHLNSYFYDLYGRGGHDRFFLGPQTSRVAGGDGNDLYFVNANGGRAIIDNFAHDQEIDTLFLNVSYERVRCVRDGWDLLVGYCQDTNQFVKIKNWFSLGNEKYHRHIYLSTQDGFVVKVTESNVSKVEHQISCFAESVDKSSSTSAVTLILTGSLAQVKHATGSNYSDVIIGNEKPNILNGGLGDDTITGANGSDIYFINRGGGRDTINNYAIDEHEDTVIFGFPFVEILLEKSHQNDLVVYTSGDRSSFQVTLFSWFEGSEWQHAVFVSSDYIRFVVKKDDDGIPRKHPLSIDLSELQRGVRLNLRNTSDNQDVHVDAILADEVKTIIDSPYDDEIHGNALGNFLSCSGGLDHLRGDGGKDTYVVNKGCSSVSIDNVDIKGDYDMVLLNCSSQNIRLMFLPELSGLSLRCDLNNRYLDVHLIEWFQSPDQRHLIVKTSDKATALLPETTEELDLDQGRLFPYQIETDEDCEGELRVVDLNIPPFSKCERFIAKTDLCSYSIIGNELNNYIDPGPGNPFGSQNLRGDNGTDTYVMGHRYGTFNTIDNFSEDKELDHLNLGVVFHDIEVSRNASDATLTSRSRNDSIRVTVVNYYSGAAFQHLLVHSVDGVVFKISAEFPYIEVIIVDFSTSMFSEVLSAQENTTFFTARVLLGSKFAENYIDGGRNTTKLIGGQKNDTIIGGPGGEYLIGLDEHDSIYAGPGNDALYGGDDNDFLYGSLDNDVFYGGMGADTIIGGLGTNTVVFSGHRRTGVSINLQIGLGWEADAEGDSYKMINNILSSEYDDILIGNDDNNVIRAYGGDDFIFPAGGDDILQGGTGSDVYQLKNAFGHKVINNFATDETLDLIVMNGTSINAMCYYFYGEDLQLTVIFDNANSSEAVSRVFLGEDFLMITVPFLLRNSTYRHIAFSFSDGYLMTEDFDESYKQLKPAIDIVQSGQLFHSVSVSVDGIILNFNVSAWSNASISQEAVSLKYVHFESNSTTYFPLNLPPPDSVIVSDLAAGSMHSFTLILSYCELTIAMSPLLFGAIPPSQPTSLIADPLLNGFFLSWTAPTFLTDPSVEEYEYIVQVWSVEQMGQYFEQTTNSSTISVFGLIPGTVYHISVSTLVHNTTSIPIQKTARAGGNTCTNLAHLPFHIQIEDLTLNEQGDIVAVVTCEKGYELEGNSTVFCNDTTSTPPDCTVTECTLPAVTNVELVLGGDIPVSGDTFTWRCLYGYEISPNGTNMFSSVCDPQSRWNPEIPTCNEKPKCTGMLAPEYGNVNATVVYVGEHVSYSCYPGYSLHGPVQKFCIRVEGNEAYLHPSDNIQCVPLLCPALLPQTHGFYNNIKSTYVTGDMVELVCDEGYYAINDRDHPEQNNLICSGQDWIPPQRHCQSIIEVFNATHYISHVEVKVRYSISSLKTSSVPESLYPQACREILPTFTEWTYTTPIPNANPIVSLDCHRTINLTYGPTPFEGILEISSVNGSAYACINNTNTATEVCRQLGYEQYTSSIYHTVAEIVTTYRSVSTSPTRIIQQEQQCNYRISCRKSCDQLFLPHGNWKSGCPQTLEGQSCDFSCDAGYGMIGSPQRICTSNGWTGNHPFCDGEMWKTDVERESREQAYRSHSELASYLSYYLENNYPGLCWMVVVYDDVSGGDRHNMAGTFYVLYRHFGHNIVVARKLPPFGTPYENLDSIFWQAYTPHLAKIRYLHAKKTVDATWNKLLDRGVNPVMLHIISRDINYGRVYVCDPGFIVRANLEKKGVTATLIV